MVSFVVAYGATPGGSITVTAVVAHGTTEGNPPGGSVTVAYGTTGGNPPGGSVTLTTVVTLATALDVHVLSSVTGGGDVLPMATCLW